MMKSLNDDMIRNINDIYKVIFDFRQTLQLKVCYKGKGKPYRQLCKPDK